MDDQIHKFFISAVSLDRYVESEMRGLAFHYRLYRFLIKKTRISSIKMNNGSRHHPDDS